MTIVFQGEYFKLTRFWAVRNEPAGMERSRGFFIKPFVVNNIEIIEIWFMVCSCISIALIMMQPLCADGAPFHEDEEVNMSFTVLRMGSRGSEVRTLQERLNTNLTPSPRLVPDGIFGSLTRNAVLRFQQANWLVEDGEVGPCTWNALTGTETYRPILHTVPFIAQPTPTTCWAASTAMVTRSTVPVVIARTPVDLILPDGSLRNFSDTSDQVTGSARFARTHGMTVVPPTSWMPVALVRMLSRGPLIFDLLWNATEYTAGRGSPGHMITVVGIRGDDDQSGLGTTLRIYDPWPPNRGRKYSMGYSRWIQEIPTLTYHIYHKI